MPVEFSLEHIQSFIARCALDVFQLEARMLFLQDVEAELLSAWRGKLGDPKTEESTRVVELSPRACENLRLHFDRWHPNKPRLVFASKNGTPWDQNMILKRRLRPLLKSLGITVPRGNGFHAFRHANATLMSRFGAPLKLRQQRLGHVDGSPVTETIYTHVVSEDGRRIAERLGDVIWSRVLDHSGPKNENGSGVEPPKPFQIN